jgi:hypothetical protein
MYNIFIYDRSYIKKTIILNYSINTFIFILIQSSLAIATLRYVTPTTAPMRVDLLSIQYLPVYNF